MILEKLHRRINEFHKAFNWRRFRAMRCTWAKAAGVRRAVRHFLNPDLGRLLDLQNQLRPGSCCRCMGGTGAAGHAGEQGLRLEQRSPGLGLTEPGRHGQTYPPTMRLNYEGKPPGYRKAGALPTGGRKNTAGRSAWTGGAVSFVRRRSFDMVQPVQEMPFRPVLTPECTTIDRIFTQYRKDKQHGRRLQGKDRSGTE